MFHKILIANRGEIAIRVMRACRELGIQTVAVYSDADKKSIHVQFADEAVHIGAAAPQESYLNAQALLHAALDTNADAIHPGYGFLSESASFAAAVEAAGLVFIGPSAESIRAMGDKAESKIRMKKAGVPTVPGVEGLVNEKEFENAAEEIGYPVLVKASAGGGGKGMRVVSQAKDLPEEIQAAKREAAHAFGDDRLLIEKYIPNAHHIEFQVFGDIHRNLLHLFERECSVQRRHQKIIEETPSPLLTPELREEMGQAAVRAANAVGYHNAGTVEFIVDPDTLKFYFLEMNTRLQVEHPVTELVTGLDLVHWQIRVAAGERFPFEQSQLHQRGHAIECRVYAEDPAQGFLPSTGKLLQFREPRGPGIRIDSGFTAGSEVTHFYDPLLAKLIVYAEDRPAAIQRMQAALKEFIVHGVVTNIDFLQAVLSHPDFANGKVTTRWVDKIMESGGLLLDTQEQAPVLHILAAALADLTIGNRKSKIENPSEPDPYSPWKAASGFRNMKLNYDDTAVDISSKGNIFILTLDDRTIQVEVLHAKDGRLDLLVDGQRVTAYVSSQNSKRWVTVNGQTLLLNKSSGVRGRGHGHHHAAGELTAPMPGQVRAVNVGEGDQVTKGQTLLLLEAMKMEIRIQSPQGGVVKKLFVKQGQTVEREQMLLEVVDILEG